ncbi:hypothetical protein U8233_002278 [Providencia rettgeri]|nr:hypothetical protein [Providencia rettgeri]
MQKYRFYHADRANSLHSGMIIDIDGLSMFGKQYTNIYDLHKTVKDLSDSENRERTLEYVRQNISAFSIRPSRLSSFFAALSIEDAIYFAKSITPIIYGKINIYEVFADKFFTCDSNWLDYKPSNDADYLEYAKRYWWGEITNHAPVTGGRRPPKLEVLLSSPILVGALVHTVDLPASD